MRGWIGVDLDATLAHYDHWVSWSAIGIPVPAMLDRVNQWLLDGREVRIFTARAADDVGTCKVSGETFTRADVTRVIQDWCVKHGLPRLPVTSVKDFGMVELWDDRAVQVEPNTGQPVTYWTTRV